MKIKGFPMKKDHFYNIECGSLFWMNDEFFIKANAVDSDRYLAVNLRNGAAFYPTEDAEVERVKATLEVIDK